MMIRYLLSKLEANSRKQVPVDILHELRASTVDISTKLSDVSAPGVIRKLRSLQEALSSIEIAPGVMFLTDKMKAAIVECYVDLRTEIHLITFEHYKVNEFEPNETIISLLREVVETAAQKGAV